MPPQTPSGLDFSGLSREPSRPSASGTDGLDFSALDAPDTRSGFAKVWDAATTPLVSEQAARGVSEAIAGQPLARLTGGVLDVVSPRGILETLQAFARHPIDASRAAAGGVVEGLAQTFTSPLDIALTAAGPAARVARGTLGAAVKAGEATERAIVAARAAGRLDDVARLSRELAAARQTAGRAQATAGAIKGLENAAAGGMVARGGERLLDDDHREQGAGVAQALMGAVGLLANHRTPAPAPPRVIRGRLVGSVRPDFMVTPEGVAGAPEAITMRPAPDGSFVKAEPATYARHEIRGLLGAPSRTVTPEGVVLPAGVDLPPSRPSSPAVDPSFVRAEPAQYARREVRGALPPGPRFVADEGGHVASLEDSAKLQGNTAQHRPTEPVAEVRAVPAAIADRTFAGAKETRRIFSGDPHAVDAPKVNLNDRERVELQRILAEMESLPYTPRTRVEWSGGPRGKEEEWLAGAGGAPVFHGITAGHSGATRADVITAITGMLEGKHSAMGQRALDEARRYIDGGGAPRMLPPDAGVRNPILKGDLSDEDFKGFSAFLDDQAAIDPELRGPGREPGEEGAINPLLLQHVAGGAAGAVLGGATGDDTESRVKRAILGGMAGAAVPSLLGRAPRIKGLASLGDQLVAKGITPAELDPRVSGLSPEAVRQSPALDTSGRFLAESGAVRNQLAQRLGGAAAGAAVGGTYGDTTEDHLKGAVVGGVAGALGSKVLGRVAGLRGATGALRISGVKGSDGVTIPLSGRKAPMPENRMRDPLAGVDVFLDKFAPEIRSGLRDVMERNAGFEAQRRGAIPQEQAERLAQSVMVDAERHVKPGTTLNVEGIRAHTDALATAQNKVNELAKLVTGGKGTDADLVALESARAEVNTIAASLMGARSEAGRSLAQFRMMAKVLASNNPQLIAETANTVRGDAAQFAAAFAKLPDDAVTRFRWLQQHDRPGVREQVRQYYMANILSGVKTHERNILGNAANTLNNLMVHPVAAGLDAMKSRATGAPRRVSLDEFPSQVAGMVAGFERGLSEALFSMKHGVNRSALTQSLSAAEAGKLDVPRVEFKGGGANPFNWPGRALDSADQFFRAIAKHQEAYGLAHAQAKREGLKGDAFTDRMASLLAGEGEHGQRIAEQADTFARRAVFQEKAGPLVGLMQAASKRVPELSFVVPFMKTPANIFRQGFEFSPAGFAMKAAKQGGRAGTQAQARAAMGSAALGGLAYLAATGRLSGSGPQDPAARAQLMESGWRPNSVKIGNQWIEYSLFQPVSIPAAAIGNAFEAWKAEGMKGDDALTKTAAAVKGFARSGLDQSFLSGVADLFEMIETASLKSGAKWLGRQAHSLTPFAGAQRSLTAAVDPNVRAPEGFTETIKTGVPGLSSSVEPRLDRFGHEVVRPGGPLRRAADPFNVSPVSDDPVVLELGRLGVTMGPQTATMALPKGAALTRAENFDVRQMKGTAVHTVLARLVAMPGYQQLPDEAKAELLQRAITKTRAIVTQRAKPAIKARLLSDVLPASR